MNMAKILYGTLFVVVVPGLLALWARAARENVALPIYGNPALGALFAVCGLAVLLVAMYELWRFGGGLPMNAFPPSKLVSHGTYALLPHPIYTGFAMLCFGMAMVARSSAGLWLVTPSVVLGCAALVVGYERLDLQRRFGQALRLLLANDEARPITKERIQFLLLSVAPWLVLYEFTIRLPQGGTAFAFPSEAGLPFVPWTILLYQSTYLAVAVAPWFARTRRDLRKLTLSAWTAMAIVFPFYWFFPSLAPHRPFDDINWMTHLMKFERAIDEPTAALPAFHVLWAIFVARLYRPRWLGVAYGAGVAVSCVTAGMHYVADVVASLALAPLFLEPQRLWEAVRRTTEGLANSWKEWRVGPVRIINHGFYAGAAGFAQVAVVTAALGPGKEWKALATAAAGLLGAGAWAQWIEGSSRLRRPFGFYGTFITTGLCCLFFEERWLLLAAHCLAAPWTQAIGRLRCLVNGCCHGCPSSSAVGIRVTHGRSRVSHLAQLCGVPIHPTPLYSILGNLFLGLLLVRLWTSGGPLQIISGIYAIGNGIARFVEEAYRGEPQTPQALGLRLYQWMAISSVILGAALTTLRSPVALGLQFSSTGVAAALAFALVTGAAMGVDFPESNRALARLT
jgi:protein-S-isoprenylcysteine O-methyltransferase Ste14